MEALQSKSRRRSIRPVIVVGVVTFVVTCGVIACGKALKAYSLKDSLGSDVPILDLHVAYYNSAGVLLAGGGEGSSKGSGANASSEAPSDASGQGKSESQSTEGGSKSSACPSVSGGDLRRSALPSHPEDEDGNPISCELSAQWNVYRHPIALSLFIQDGGAVIDWYEQNPSFSSLRDTPLWKGLTEAVSVVLKVRGVDLALPTLPLADWSGQFLKPLFKEVLRADATLHYDLIHGAGGVVLSFNKEKTSMVAQALPLLINHLGSAAYEVEVPSLSNPSATKALGTVVQVRLQGRKFYVYEANNRVSIGTSLEGLLNVLSNEEALSPPQREVPPQTSALAVVRGEAFFDKLLPVVVGKSEAPIVLALGLSRDQSVISQAEIPDGPFTSALAAEPFQGIVASVPKDILGALITSAKVPVDQPVSQWSFASAANENNGGLALVWDVHGEDGTFHYGVAVAAPADLEVGQDNERLHSFLSDGAVATTCAGSAVWLGASSDLLLSRMQEACNKKSLSILDGKEGGGFSPLSKQQLSILLNSKVAVKELYRLGGGATYSTDEAASGEVAAQKKLLAETDRVADSLPILGLSGGVGAGNPRKITLKGFSQS